jgi:hypothetical protein
MYCHKDTLLAVTVKLSIMKEASVEVVVDKLKVIVLVSDV